MKRRSEAGGDSRKWPDYPGNQVARLTRKRNGSISVKIDSEHALSKKAEVEALPPGRTAPDTLHNVEPNSSLGVAMNYLLNHFDTLTRYCHYPGIPIDNNEIERLIKLAVRNRKNSGYFKTQAGAWVGDILISIIAICQENGINVFDYLTAVQCNRKAVRANPSAWLPWNYPVSA